MTPLEAAARVIYRHGALPMDFTIADASGLVRAALIAAIEALPGGLDAAISEEDSVPRFALRRALVGEEPSANLTETLPAIIM